MNNPLLAEEHQRGGRPEEDHIAVGEFVLESFGHALPLLGPEKLPIVPGALIFLVPAKVKNVRGDGCQNEQSEQSNKLRVQLKFILLCFTYLSL